MRFRRVGARARVVHPRLESRELSWPEVDAWLRARPGRRGRVWVHPAAVADIPRTVIRLQYQQAMLRGGIAGHLVDDRVPVWVSEAVPLGEAWLAVDIEEDRWLRQAACPAPKPADWEEHMRAAYERIPRLPGVGG